MRSNAKRLAALAAVGFVVAATFAGRVPAQDQTGSAPQLKPAADSAVKIEANTPPEGGGGRLRDQPVAPPKASPPADKEKALGAAADTVRQLELAVEKDTANYDKNYRLGVAFLDHDRSQDAIATFQRCTRLRPGEIKSWVNLGIAQDAVGKGPDARISYRKALALSPDDELALCRLAASHYAAGQQAGKAAAMDTLRVVLAKHPRSSLAYFQLGVAFADAVMYKEAIRAWEKVIEIAPSSLEALSAQESISVLREQMGNP